MDRESRPQGNCRPPFPHSCNMHEHTSSHFSSASIAMMMMMMMMMYMFDCSMSLHRSHLDYLHYSSVDTRNSGVSENYWSVVEVEWLANDRREAVAMGLSLSPQATSTWLWACVNIVKIYRNSRILTINPLQHCCASFIKSPMLWHRRSILITLCHPSAMLYVVAKRCKIGL